MPRPVCPKTWDNYGNINFIPLFFLLSQLQLFLKLFYVFLLFYVCVVHVPVYIFKMGVLCVEKGIFSSLLFFSSKFCIVHNLISIHMSHVTRKPVFEIFDQVRLKPACSATEAS